MIWRKSWADKANEYLSKNGLGIRISEKSNQELGIEKKPTIHDVRFSCMYSFHLCLIYILFLI